jgi:hypothetical protein
MTAFEDLARFSTSKQENPAEAAKVSN